MRFEQGRDTVALIGWAALLAPLGTVLHELGHWTVARLNGIPVKLNPTSVTPLDGAPESAFPAIGQAAGPIVTLLLTFGAVLLVRRLGPRRPLVAIALTAPVRMLVIYAFLGVSLMLAVRGLPGPHPNFDEYNALRSLGFPVVPILILIAILLPLAWGFTIRSIPKGQRLRTAVAVLVGGAIGSALWVLWVGPALLG